MNQWQETSNKENETNNNSDHQEQNDFVIALDQSDPQDAVLIDNANLRPNGKGNSILSFFEIVAEDGDKIKAKCSKCPGVYCAAKSSCSNLITHLKRKHPVTFNEYKLKSSSSKRRNRIVPRTGDLTQDQFDHFLKRFIVNGMHPFSVVEQPEFREYTYGLLGYAEGEGPIKIPSRFTITTQMMELHAQHKSDLISLLDNVEYVCETADIWSNRHRSFLGVTAHWLDPSTLERISVALCCVYLTTPHTHEKIAETLQLLNHEFGITNKIVATVTDNASNFGKAFNEFGLPWENLDYDPDSIGNDIQLEDLGDCALSYQHRCTSHTLSLIGKVDSLSALDDGFYFRAYKSAMDKLEKVWSLSRNQRMNEIFKMHTDSSIQRPLPIRWNATQDAVENITKKDSEKLRDAMTAMGIDALTSIDREFLAEYIKVFKPLTILIDHMQQTSSHYGILLPALFSTQYDLIQMRKRGLKYCLPLVSAIIDGIDDRFGPFFDFDSEESRPAVLASVTHPHFKLRWIENELDASKAKDILLKAANDLPVTQIQNQEPFHASQQKSGFRYHFVNPNNIMERTTKEEEILKYLNSPCSDQDDDFTQLENYPTIKRLFHKYNTVLTSEAPAERLFSYGGMILRPHRQAMNNEHFEAVLMLKSNLKLIEKYYA